MNKITASIEFSFKGEEHRPSAILDLDDIMKKNRTIPPLHLLIATLNNIDSYSYEYEVLLSEDIKFTLAEGDAANFVHDDQFDQIAFEQYWLEQELLSKLSETVKQELDIDDINQHPALKSALIKAYEIGKESI